MSKINLKRIGKIMKKAFAGFTDDKVFKMSASLAYYTIFSIGPMIIVIIFLADLFYGREAIEGTIYGQLSGLVGNGAALQIQEIIKNASISGESTVAATIGVITLIIGATTVFAEIQDSINTIWNLKAKASKSGIVKMLLTRLVSFSVVISLGFILLVSLIVNGLIEGLMDRLQRVFPDVTVVLVYVVNLIVTFAVITALFSIIFKVLPDAKIKWKDVFVGAMATAVLFMIGKFGISLYIGQSDIGGTYGAAGSMVILLLWVYYSSLILYFGAEFTKAYAAEYGHHIYPNNYAVWVKQVTVEENGGSLVDQEKKKEAENLKTGDHVKVT